MPPNEPTFDRSALILAWISRKKYRNAHEDLRNYHNAIYAAFTKVFSVDLEVAPESSPIPDKDGLHGLFLGVARSYEDIRSPFSSYLCGTREISEMYQKYGEPLEESASSMRNLHLMLMVELVERIWGGDVPHRVSQQALDACGYPSGTVPDPVDYW